MRGRKSPLDHVTVAAPCNVGWENMTGGERVRFCSQCSLNVYNLSGMTKSAAERLVVQAEGRLCVRFYRRADGTILTKDCPVGLSALRKRTARVAKATASAALSFVAGVLAAAGLRQQPTFTNAMIESEAVEVQPVLPGPGDVEFAGPPIVGDYRSKPVGEYVEGRMQIQLPKRGRFKRH